MNQLFIIMAYGKLHFVTSHYLKSSFKQVLTCFPTLFPPLSLHPLETTCMGDKVSAFRGCETTVIFIKRFGWVKFLECG